MQVISPAGCQQTLQQSRTRSSVNINVVVRSLTQAAMVLVFMFHASWRLTVITFIMLPATISICRVTVHTSGLLLLPAL